MQAGKANACYCKEYKDTYLGTDPLSFYYGMVQMGLFSMDRHLPSRLFIIEIHSRDEANLSQEQDSMFTRPA